MKPTPGINMQQTVKKISMRNLPLLLFIALFWSCSVTTPIYETPLSTVVTQDFEIWDLENLSEGDILRVRYAYPDSNFIVRIQENRRYKLKFVEPVKK